jgi:microcystin-dependent protein
MSTNISLTMGTLSKSCYGDLQEHAVDLVSQMTGTVLDGSLKYIISETAPGADDRDKLWIKTSSGAPVRQYVYYNGAWVWPHNIPAGDTKLQIYKGSAESVATLDGGTAGAVGSSSGPFWEIDPDLSGKFPLGAGTLPSGTEVNSGTTGGSETVTLTSDQLPDHGHLGEAYYRAQAGAASGTDPSGLADDTLHENAGHTTRATYNNFNKAGVITTSMTGTTGQAHNNMPPYYGVYFIKRTARQYYVG